MDVAINKSNYKYQSINFINSNAKIPSYLCELIKNIILEVGYGFKQISLKSIYDHFNNVNKKYLQDYKNKTKPETRKISELRKFPFLNIEKNKDSYSIQNNLNLNFIANLNVRNKEIINKEIDSTLILLLLAKDNGLNFYFNIVNELNKFNIKFNIEFLVILLGYFKENKDITIDKSIEVIKEVNLRYINSQQTKKNLTMKEFTKKIFNNQEYGINVKYNTCFDYAITAFFYLERTNSFKIDTSFKEKNLIINQDYIFKTEYFLNKTADEVLEDIKLNNFLKIYENIKIEKLYKDIKTNLNNPMLIDIDKFYKPDYNWAEFECRNVILFCQKLYLNNKELYKTYEKEAAIKLNSIKKPTSTTSGIPDLYIKTDDIVITIEPTSCKTILQLCNNELYSCQKHLKQINSSGGKKGICFVITPKKLNHGNDYSQKILDNNYLELINSKRECREANFLITLSEKEFIDLNNKENIIQEVINIYLNETIKCIEYAKIIKGVVL